MRKYITTNRYNDKVVFTEVEENVFTFETFNKKGEKSKYWRTGYNSEDGIEFVDPSGGPFIAVGSNFKDIAHNFPDLIVESIDKEGKLHVK